MPYYVAAFVFTDRPHDPPEMTGAAFDGSTEAWEYVDALPDHAREGIEWRVYRLARVWPLGESS